MAIATGNGGGDAVFPGDHAGAAGGAMDRSDGEFGGAMRVGALGAVEIDALTNSASGVPSAEGRVVDRSGTGVVDKRDEADAEMPRRVAADDFGGI
jgi:hypothetical protein